MLLLKGCAHTQEATEDVERDFADAATDLVNDLGVIDDPETKQDAKQKLAEAILKRQYPVLSQPWEGF